MMWKRPARADLALILLLAVPAAASDLGAPVTFGSRPGAAFKVAADPLGAGRTLYDSGPSDQLTGPGQVLLFSGYSPDPGVLFHAGRESFGGWVGWEAEVHRFPNGRFWARATLPRAAGRVRIWAFDDGVVRDHRVEILSVEAAEEAGESPSVSTAPPRVPARPQHPDAVEPPFHDRAEWKAKPPTDPYEPIGLPWRITLHHSDGHYTTTLKESLDETRFIQDFHQNGRKWIDIAYHFLVDPQGNIIQGRPEQFQGAHTLANNEGNVGICLLGTYHPPKNDRPTPAQLDAVAAIARYLVLRHGIDPVEFKGHRDYKSTDCPGDLGYAQLPRLRERADGGAAEEPQTHRGRRRRGLALPAAAPLELPAWDGQRQASRIAVPSASR